MHEIDQNRLRWRLMRRRFRSRIKRVPALALVVGCILFLFDWAGYRGKFEPLGQHRELIEIWWHLPALVVGLTLVMLLLPWRIDNWDDI